MKTKLDEHSVNYFKILGCKSVDNHFYFLMNIQLFVKRRSKDELISDVLLWTPTYGCAKAGRPARTYIQQLCEDTGCNPEDLPEAKNDREKWRERVRDIRADGTTWWWWFLLKKLNKYFPKNKKNISTYKGELLISQNWIFNFLFHFLFLFSFLLF